MSLMMQELFEAPQVIKNATDNCSLVAKEIASAVKARGIKRVILAGRGSSLHAGIAFKFFLETTTPYILSFEYPSMVTSFNVVRDLTDSLYIVSFPPRASARHCKATISPVKVFVAATAFSSPADMGRV